MAAKNLQDIPSMQGRSRFYKAGYYFGKLLKFAAIVVFITLLLTFIMNK